MRRTVAPPNASARPIGLSWLIERYALPVPEPMVRSEVVDMPDVPLRSLVTYLHQNGGRLSNNERKQFPELTDTEIERILEVVRPLFDRE